MQVEAAQAKIEGYTSNLVNAVSAGDKAHFSMLLSMVSATYEQSQQTPGNTFIAPTSNAEKAASDFVLPEAQLTYPNISQLHTQTAVSRLSDAVHTKNQGDLAYVLSTIHTQAQKAITTSIDGDEAEQVGLMSAGKLLLDEIRTYREMAEGLADMV